MNAAIGVIAIIGTIYCLSLSLLHIRLEHKVNPIIRKLSYTSSILLVFAIFNILLSYFTPQVSGFCFCHAYYSMGTNSYIIAIYLMKFTYIKRMKIFNRQSTLKNTATTIYIYAITITLILSAISCIYLMIFHVSGTCMNNSEFGCKSISVDPANVYVALFMIVIDCILFGIFAYKWYKIVNGVTNWKQKSGSKIPKSVLTAFISQFTCVCIGLISCAIDAFISSMYTNYYDIIIMFLIDCCVVATCNFFTLRESKQFAINLLCGNKNKGTSDFELTARSPGTVNTSAGNSVITPDPESINPPKLTDRLSLKKTVSNKSLGKELMKNDGLKSKDVTDLKLTISKSEPAPKSTDATIHMSITPKAVA